MDTETCSKCQFFTKTNIDITKIFFVINNPMTDLTILLLALLAVTIHSLKTAVIVYRLIIKIILVYIDINIIIIILDGNTNYKILSSNI